MAVSGADVAAYTSPDDDAAASASPAAAYTSPDDDASASPATLRCNNAPTAADCFGRKVSVCSAKPLHAQQTIMWMVVNMTCAKPEGSHDQCNKP